MFFDVAGIWVNPLIPPLVAFGISFLTSMGGVSGAFLILPFQVSVLGFTSPAVSPTNQLYNIIAIPSGVYRYIKEGRMVWPLTWIVIIGTLPGVFIGAIMRVNLLQNPETFKVFAGFILLYIGLRVFWDLIKKDANNNNSSEVRFQELVKNFKNNTLDSEQTSNFKYPSTKVKIFNLKKLEYEFYGETYTVPTLKIMIISLLVGIIGGIYGIGGGAIMAPIYIAIFKLPVYTVAGAALMGTFITSVVGVVFYQAIAPFYPKLSVAPDWLLGTLFGAGGIAGMYCGARLQKFMPAKLIKWILCISIFFIGVKYVLGLFKF